MSVQVLGEVTVSVVLFGTVAAYWFVALRSGARHERTVVKAHDRAVRARLAAVEAAESDPSFSPDAIEQAVAAVVAAANGLWRGGGREGLGDRPDAGLVRAWARARQARLGDGLTIDRAPAVDLLSVVNRDGQDEDRVEVRVRCRIRCRHPSDGASGPRQLRLDERWTFGHHRGGWVLLSTSGDPFAGAVLTAPLVPNPAADLTRLDEQSLGELAAAQKVGDDVKWADLVSADSPPNVALADLAPVDNRFGPELIALDLRHLLEAWEEAATGSEAPLSRLASQEARDALLRPARWARLVVRDVVLRSWEATKLDLSRDPPAIEVSVGVEAVRFVVDAGGNVATGSTTTAHPMQVRWVIELTDAVGTPWRLVQSTRAANEIPGWA